MKSDSTGGKNCCMNELNTQEELRSSARMERNRLVHLGHARENGLCGCNADKWIDRYHSGPRPNNDNSNQAG